MAKVLIVYATREGHTGKIARYMAQTLRRLGHDVEVSELGAGPVPSRLAAYDGVLVGASVHAGKHEQAAVDFASTHAATLAKRPSGFFSVSLSAAGSKPSERADVARMLEEFAQSTGWHPTLCGGIAGALLYTRYNPIVRFVMKRMVRPHRPQDTDTTRDYEYTDWDGVAHFAHAFAATIRADGTDAKAQRAQADGAGARAH